MPMTDKLDLAGANEQEYTRLLMWLARHMDSVGTFVVSGSQEWINWRLLFRVLDAIPMQCTMFEGHAFGADCLAKVFWEDAGGVCRAFKANWSALGKRAGHVRNELMMECMPGFAVVFIRAFSPGSEDARRLAMLRHIPTFVFRGT